MLNVCSAGARLSLAEHISSGNPSSPRVAPGDLVNTNLLAADLCSRHYSLRQPAAAATPTPCHNITPSGSTIAPL